MNTTINVNTMIEKNWTELKGMIKSKWGKVNEEEIESVKSDLNQLAGKIQKAYGIAKDQADHQYDEFKKSVQSLIGPETPAARPALALAAVTDPVPESVMIKAKLN